MKKLILTLLTGAILTIGLPAQAQENLLANKPIHPLGGAKTWSATNDKGEVIESQTFKVEDLNKLVAVPTNTSNVFLYPENGTLNTEENQAKGAQVFYIDMEAVTSVGTVTTTWEGAAADSFNIYLTDDVPTEDVLSTNPTYSVSGLKSYTENLAVLKAGSKGRYLVFQVTKASNWGWGIKMRSISAEAPKADQLTTFKVSPSIVKVNQETPISITALNQFGIEMNIDDVEITVSDNAVYKDGNLTIKSGSNVIFTASYGGVDLTATVYVPTAPKIPDPIVIKTPIYTNGVTEKNSTAEWTTAYNGGAQDLGELTFEGGEVAWQFGATRCVFFNNKETTGEWTNAHLNPSANGWRNLSMDVFPGEGNEMTIKFEGTEGLSASNFSYTLNAGEWNTITLDVSTATNINNMSFTYAEGSATDIVVANIYFTPTELGEDIERIPTRLQINLDDDSMWVNERKDFSYSIFDQYDIELKLETAPIFSITDNAEIIDNTILAKKGGVITFTIEVGELSESVNIYVADIDDYCLNNAKATADRVENSVITNLFDGGKELDSDREQFKFTDDNMELAGLVNHWALIDLQAEYDLQRIYIHWEGACSKEFEVLVGGSDAFKNIDDETDESNFRSVYGIQDRPGMTDYKDNIYGEGLEGVRYIKVHSYYNATDYGLKIWDLKAYGKLSHPDKVVTVGEMEKAMAWHPVGIEIEKLVQLNGVEDSEIEVTIEPLFDRDFRGTGVTDETSGLSEYDWHVYSAIAAGCTVTVKGESTKGAKCDGFLLNEPKALIDAEGNFTADIDCSGLYKVTFTGSNSVTFQEDELYSTRIERTLEVYPSIEHKYTYEIDNQTNTDDCFRIDDYYLHYDKGVVYDETETANLSNAWIQFPGVYDADFYFYIESSKGGEDVTEGELRIKRKANTELPSEYSQYTKIEDGHADLSALANGGTLHIVVAKNGAITPLLAAGSESQISFTTSDSGNTTTGVGSIEEGVADATVDVYTLQGIRVMKGVNASEAASQLPAGIYIIGGKKVAVGSK